MKRFCLMLLILATIAQLPAVVRADDSADKAAQAQRARTEAAIQRWQAMRFGMFIHWGPVSLKGTEIGWSRQGPRRGHLRGGTGTVPVEEYDNLYKQFNPVKFDAEQWAQIAQDAGMKYMVFTSKHHDGFSNFDSRYTDYKITNPDSPYGKDICRQLADACHKDGLALGWYYSPRDWHHPDFATEHHDRYLKFYMGQLRELCTNYGRVDILWFDGLDSPRELWGDTPEQSFTMLRALQKDIILNNRGGLPGDFDTPEQRIGGFNRQRPWETCMTICRQWAWKPNDKLKSREECLQTLLRTVGGDGNLLFNVGPMPDGRIEPRQVERLHEMGQWLRKYGQGVYGTRGGPFKPGKWGASTCKENHIYLFVMDWPEEGPLQLPPINAQVTSPQLLSGGTMDFMQTDAGISIDVPKTNRDSVATVIALTVPGTAFAIEPVTVRHKSSSLTYDGKASASNIYRNLSIHGPDKAIDEDSSTRWATDSGTHAAWLSIDMHASKTFNRVLIDEETPYARTQEFELQSSTDGKTWTTFYKGKTIGPKWTTTFAPVTARYVRLNILKATEGPTLAEFHVYAPR